MRGSVPEPDSQMVRAYVRSYDVHLRRTTQQRWLYCSPCVKEACSGTRVAAWGFVRLVVVSRPARLARHDTT